MFKQLEKLNLRTQVAVKLLSGVVSYFIASSLIRKINPSATWIWVVLGIVGAVTVYFWVQQWQKPARNVAVLLAAVVIIALYALVAR